MIKETSRRKNSSLSRKRSSSNATNIFADSAKENIFSRKSFARVAQNVALEKIFFCAVSENVCCVWWCSFARQARIFSAWGFFYHLFKRKFFELAALNFCAYVFKDLRVRLFLFERVALTLCAHSCAASAHHHCAKICAAKFERWVAPESFGLNSNLSNWIYEYEHELYERILIFELYEHEYGCEHCILSNLRFFRTDQFVVRSHQFALRWFHA